MKFLKPGKVVVLTSGRYAGRKAVIVRNYDEGTNQRPYGHALIAGVKKYPKQVKRKHSKKQEMKRSKVKSFVKMVNYNHFMPTRYTLDLELKSFVTPDALDKREKRNVTRKKVSKAFTERHRFGKNRWFFTKLHF